MKNAKFLKEAGYMYDLFFLFTLYFNEETWVSQIVNTDKMAGDMEYFGRILDEYLPISDELQIFFHMAEGNRAFITERYYDPYKEDLISGKYNLAVVLEALSDYDKVIDNVIRFYFREITDEELAECRGAFRALNKLIAHSNYKNDLKVALYSFFLDPVSAIQKLTYELITKDVMLRQQYEKRYQALLSAQGNFDCESVIEGLNKIGNPSIVKAELEEIYVSFCLCYKNVIAWQFYDNAMLMTLGIDYVDTLESLAEKEKLPDLDLFGTALSEKNRVELLNLMAKMGEVSIKDVERELGYTGTNAYYHISLMLKVGMLNTRNRGRTVLYRINKEYFTIIRDAINNYIQ